MLGLEGHGRERRSTPTTPEAAREMKPPSNYANHLRQKPREFILSTAKDGACPEFTEGWSACVCFPFVQCVLSVRSKRAIDFAAMSHVKYHYLLCLCVNFVYDAIVAYNNPI